MLRFHPRRFGWLLVLALGLWAVMAQAQEFRYRYVSLRQVELPTGFRLFDPITINNRGRVYGNAYDRAFFLPHVAVYAEGVITVLQPGFVYVANKRGTIGGSVLVDTENFIEQAALFHGDQVELIPRQSPEEVTSAVVALNDAGVALVTSSDAVGQQTVVLYQHGRTTPLDFGLPGAQTFGFLDLNNRGSISGTAGSGFRFDTRTGQTTQLDPLPTEPFAWALGINNRGDVLGYSFGGLPYIERIGVWDRDGEFQTYFVEDIVSNRLLFNDHNLIVITRISSPASESLKNSYLVPEPGVRLNLADLVENLPVGVNLSFILDINNHGDMIGLGSQGAFLLERIGVRGR
jgi:hypothetical protein